MSFIEDSFHSWLTNTVEVETRTGVDEYGKPAYAAAAEVKCYLAFRPKLIAMDDGSRAISRTQAWCPPTPVITPDDRVTLADGEQPRLLAVETLWDENGNKSHQELMFA
jgi:hypothetical protein